MSTYLFHEPGCIPGVPGIYAHCQVTVGDDGAVDVQPLAQQPHFEPADAPTADIPATASQDELTNEAPAPENIEEA